MQCPFQHVLCIARYKNKYMHAFDLNIDPTYMLYASVLSMTDFPLHTLKFWYVFIIRVQLYSWNILIDDCMAIFFKEYITYIHLNMY